MTLELYNFPASTCSLKVRICLVEKDLDWSNYSFKLSEIRHLAPDYLKINPNGVVPTLVHDGVPIIDSSVILEYLDEVFPSPSFTPNNPLGRAKMRSWLRYFEEKPTPAVRYPTFNRILIRNYQDLSEEEFEKQANMRPLKAEFYKRMGREGFPENDIKIAIHDIQQTVDRMEDLGYEQLWEARHPHVTSWFKRMKARPAYSKAYSDGSRYSEIYPDIGLGRSLPEVSS